MKEENKIEKEEKISKKLCAVEVAKLAEEIRKVSILSIIFFFSILGCLLVSFEIGVILVGLGSGIMAYYTYKATNFRMYLREKYGV